MEARKITVASSKVLGVEIVTFQVCNNKEAATLNISLPIKVERVKVSDGIN